MPPRVDVRYQARRVRRNLVRRFRDMKGADHDPLDVAELALLLEGSPLRWRVTGMAAINHHLGFELREPHDLDIQIPVDDAVEVLRALPAWEHYYVDERAWLRWRGRPLPHGVRRVVSRRARGEPWAVEWLLTPVEHDEWVYAYDSRVRAPWWPDGADRGATAFARPEVPLLYKSRMGRTKDSTDFDAVVDHLDPDTRSFLAWAIGLGDPEHPWLARLSGAS